MGTGLIVPPTRSHISFQLERENKHVITILKLAWLKRCPIFWRCSERAISQRCSSSSIWSALGEKQHNNAGSDAGKGESHQACTTDATAQQHLGEVSATTWPRLTLCLQGQRGEGQLWPIIHQADSCVAVFTGPGTSAVAQEKREWVCERIKERTEEKKVWVFQEKRERRNKQTKQVVGVTYQVPLVFPSFHAFLEAL